MSDELDKSKELEGNSSDQADNIGNNPEKMHENTATQEAQDSQTVNEELNEFKTENSDMPRETVTEHVKPEPINKPKRFNLKSKKFLLIALFVVLVGVAIAYVLLSSNSEEPIANNASPQNQTKQAKSLGAEVSLLEGVSEISTDNKTWETLVKNNAVKEGDYVRTGASGRVIIALDDGSAIRLNKNSRIHVQKLTVDEVLIVNDNGEVYTRIVPIQTRKFSVSAYNETYTAKGTAYKTINTVEKAGVEVYQSTVSTGKAEVDVKEGKTYYTKNADKKLENVLGDVNIEALKADDFVKWNLEQDKKDKDFAAALGVLKQLETPAPASAPAATTPNGIVLSGSAGTGAASFSWSVKGIDVSGGYKLVKSSKTSTPTYPDNSAAFIEAGKSSYTLTLSDGGTYYFRLCAYRSSKTCDSYSNSIKLTIAAKAKEPVVPGALGLSITGSTASWTVAGTAPYGFKVLIADSGTPSIDNYDYKKGTSSTSYNLAEVGLANGTWYVQVCKITYEGNGLTDCSDTKTYVKTP